jgi:predicted homoserine dehydrogenase-like protein
MSGINSRLKEIENHQTKINVSVAGTGQMGLGLIAQLKSLKAFNIVAVANKSPEKSIEKLKSVGYCMSDLVSASFNGRSDKKSLTGKLNLEALSGKVIVSDSITAISELECADVVVDATGSPEAGAEIAFCAIENKKHMVTLNVEADTAIGPLLKKMADSADVVYTVAAGDEPAALKELYDFACTLGFEVVAAGKGKNNPLDRGANPTSLKQYSEQKGTSPRMMTSFVDGTKSMLEMACFSNSTGIIPDCRGMHAPEANVADLTRIFSLKQDGGILEKKGVVDFAVGNVAPGVFLVYSTDLKILREELKYLLFGDGPNYLLYRPFHLASMEVPISIANAYLSKQPTIAPEYGLVSEVIAAAKKDLEPGDIIDGIGGYTIYGLIELHAVAKNENFVPIALMEGAIVKRKIKKDTPLKYEDLEVKKGTQIFKLRKLLESSA